MDVNTLNALVSSAIWRAEQLEQLQELRDAALSAWLEVSKLEEEIAKIKPAKDAEGRIARRGSVRAALKANDFTRAKELVRRFSKESGAQKQLHKELRALLDTEAEDQMTQRPKTADAQEMISFVCQAFGSLAGSYPISKANPSVLEKVKVKETVDKLDSLMNLQVTIHYTGPQVTIYNLTETKLNDKEINKPTAKPHHFVLHEASHN